MAISKEEIKAALSKCSMCEGPLVEDINNMEQQNEWNFHNVDGAIAPVCWGWAEKYGTYGIG